MLKNKMKKKKPFAFNGKIEKEKKIKKPLRKI